VSQENVEVVRRIAAAVGGREVSVFLELTDPTVEWHTSLSVVSKGGAYHGHEGVRQYVRDLDEAFQLYEVDLDGLLGVGDLVLAVGRIRYRGHASGIEMEAPVGWVFRFRDRKVLYLRAFRDPEQTLEALGMAE
jgi:ketosteroid isomerase-like protein